MRAGHCHRIRVGALGEQPVPFALPDPVLLGDVGLAGLPFSRCHDLPA
jgi:hypothetical protein